MAGRLDQEQWQVDVAGWIRYNTDMIRKLTGIVTDVDLGSVILDVNGVGYWLRVSNTTLSNLTHSAESEITLFTYLAVRENSMDLYGFMTKEDLQFFELLLGISGIGPKSALGILDCAPVETIKEGVAGGDAVYLSKISGISKKVSEKIILQLKDKIGSMESQSKNNNTNGGMAIEALVQLGYSERDARETIQKISKDLSTEDMIKEALKNLL